MIGCSYPCPEHNKETIHIISNIEIDSVDSDVSFPERTNDFPFKMRTSQVDMGEGPVQLTIFVGEDSLSYLFPIKNMVDVYVVIDSLQAESCSSVYGVQSAEGFDHYRVDSGRLYSCVFYFEPSCQ